MSVVNTSPLQLTKREKEKKTTQIQSQAKEILPHSMTLLMNWPSQTGAHMPQLHPRQINRDTQCLRGFHHIARDRAPQAYEQSQADSPQSSISPLQSFNLALWACLPPLLWLLPSLWVTKDRCQSKAEASQNWKGQQSCNWSLKPLQIPETCTPLDAKVTSAILHIIMEEVFWGTGAEVTTNEVVAEVATRGICEVCALIYI